MNASKILRPYIDVSSNNYIRLHLIGDNGWAGVRVMAALDKALIEDGYVLCKTDDEAYQLMLLL